MKKNKTGKYFKYAIGEIILVVIGILIALQINNWNQERALKIEEKTIVKNIHNEYLQNKKIIKTTLEVSDDCMHVLKSLMGLFSKDEELIKKQNIDSLMFSAFNVPIFRPSQNTISGLIQSGRLDLLQNQELVNLIYEWGTSMKASTDASERILINIDNVVLPYLSKKYPFKDMDTYGSLKWETKTNLEVDKFQIFKEIEFENIVDDFLYRVSENNRMLLELNLLITKILEETAND